MFQTSPGSVNEVKASMVQASMRWGATGTPASASLTDFVKQLIFLCRSDVARCIPNPNRVGAAPWHTFLDKISAFTVRHSKSQRIGGSDALALPDATTTTVMLTMSPLEKEVYKLAKARTSVSASCVNNGAKAFVVQRYLAAEVGGEFEIEIERLWGIRSCPGSFFLSCGIFLSLPFPFYLLARSLALTPTHYIYHTPSLCYLLPSFFSLRRLLPA